MYTELLAASLNKHQEKRTPHYITTIYPNPDIFVFSPSLEQTYSLDISGQREICDHSNNGMICCSHTNSYECLHLLGYSTIHFYVD
jgi:hypothetical protein